MYDLKRERAHDLVDEIRPLIERHYAEIAHYPDIALDPDFDIYLDLEEAGVLRCYTIRLESQLIGYSLFVVKRNLHYKGSLQANEDILFVAPEHRKSRAGITLIRFCDDMLQKDGVQVVYHHMKAKHSFGPLLEREGYQLLDLIYAKRLDQRL